MSGDSKQADYYAQQLARINLRGEYPASVQFIGPGMVRTNYLSLTPESARAIIGWLLGEFGVPAGEVQPAAPLKRAPEWRLTTVKRDANGNNRVRVEGENGRGFSIQTLDNLPRTHREGICPASRGEVEDFIRAHGTARQRAIVGV